MTLSRDQILQMAKKHGAVHCDGGDIVAGGYLMSAASIASFAEKVYQAGRDQAITEEAARMMADLQRLMKSPTEEK